MAACHFSEIPAQPAKHPVANTYAAEHTKPPRTDSITRPSATLQSQNTAAPNTQNNTFPGIILLPRKNSRHSCSRRYLGHSWDARYSLCFPISALRPPLRTEATRAKCRPWSTLGALCPSYMASPTHSYHFHVISYPQAHRKVALAYPGVRQFVSAYEKSMVSTDVCV